MVLTCRVRLVRSEREIDGLTRPCVLVPTMGALHAGHASLVRQGAALARARGWPGGVVVTVFVNPTQFNERADFDRYPRTLEADAAVCAEAGATAVVAPSVESVYPDGLGSGVPRVPEVATRPGLEDAHRAGHFAGVCQVVLRLFRLVRPEAAIFGEKDWQQLQVVRAMVRELSILVEIIPGPTVRESDGLAMSSRNRFLGPRDRERASALSRALREAAREPDPAAAEATMARVLGDQGITPDYAVVRDALTLLAVGSRPPVGAAYRALIAAKVGPVRLLDNAGWPA